MESAVSLADPEQRPLSGRMHHYTSLDAFLSIVEHRMFRATSLNYLNDASEGVLGIRLMRDVVAREQASATGIDKEFLDYFLRWLDDPIQRDIAGAVYVLCFSERRDDLSQWRGYTPHGRGISIGINIAVLVSRAQQMGGGWTFQNCRYREDSQLAWANATVSRLRSAVPKNLAGSRQLQFSQVVGSNMDAVLQTAALMKHEAFAAEQEVRLISPLISHNDSRVKFRAGRSTIIPYIEFPLVSRLEDRLQEVEIGIGPGPTQPLAHAAVAYLMERSNFSRAVNYHRSPTPYREL